jgi:hypothetical protein
MLRKTQGESDLSRLRKGGGGALTAQRSNTEKTKAIGKRQRPICTILIRGGSLGEAPTLLGELRGPYMTPGRLLASRSQSLTFPPLIHLLVSMPTPYKGSLPPATSAIPEHRGRTSFAPPFRKPQLASVRRILNRRVGLVRPGI